MESTHFLLVDDDKRTLRWLERVLSARDYKISFAGDGNEALSIIRKCHRSDVPVDIVITDVKMPGMDGVELLKKIKRYYPSIAVIVMTGFAEDFTYEKVIESGASDFFQKPINSKELMLRLERALKERILLAERNRTDEELKESFEKLRRSQEQTVAALASTAEIRDPYTSGHQMRVTKLACFIAEHMGLSAELIEGLRIAGLLHDIGKISVPAEILSKPGKITKDEYNIIKNHCQVGYDILKEIEFQWPVAKIVLQHHERMDGSGYPLGIKGEEIILEARILAVADVIEAMSSHRPYRPGLGLDKALEEIIEKRGILFDPMVVDACLELSSSGKLKFLVD